MTISQSGTNPFFTNTGGIAIAAGQTMAVNGGVSLGTAGYVASSPTGSLTLAGGLTGTTQDADLFQPLGSLTIQGPGSASSPELLEVMSQDLGNDLGRGSRGTSTTARSAWPTTLYVRLVDQLPELAQQYRT